MSVRTVPLTVTNGHIIKWGDFMNKRIFLIIIILLIVLGSYNFRTYNSKEIIGTDENDIELEEPVGLPDNFTNENIKAAFLEQINYRLWFYPYEYYYIGSPENNRQLENYINKPVDAEIRVYTNTENAVYIHTDIGEWLAIFKYKEGFVYCDGLIQKDGYSWPSDIENYEVIEKFSFIIPEPHKPNYGTSERKDDIIAKIDAFIEVSLEDLYEASNNWANTEVYIADFYEYQVSTQIFLFPTDGDILYFPVAFEEIKGELQIWGVKGFSIEASRIHEYEKFMSDAVRYYIWSPEK